MPPSAAELIDEAAAAPFAGWDFSWLEQSGRYRTEPLPWSLRALARPHLDAGPSALDMGTGGGERFADHAPHPPVTWATEAWAPNVPVAGARLRPLGIGVAHVEGALDNAEFTPGTAAGRLPFRTGSFGLVLNRHEAFNPDEVVRVLDPERGTFLTQQVGPQNELEWRDHFEREGGDPPGLTLDAYADQLEAAGFVVDRVEEAFPVATFADAGAVAYYLKAISWFVDGFDPDRDRHHLERLHAQAPITVRSHRQLLMARSRLRRRNEHR